MQKASIQRMVIQRFWLLLVTFSVTATAMMAQTTNWTGTNSTDWNTAGNWSAGVPTAGSDVVIPSTPTNQPIISTTALANSVEVQSGASLSIASAGSLSVNGSASANPVARSIGFYNGGTVVSGGRLVLGNTGSVGNYGLWNTGIFRNVAGGYLTIDRASNTGLDNVGSFVNSSTLLIGQGVSAGSIGLYNASSFSNTAGGYLTIDQVSATGLYNDAGSFVNSSTLLIGQEASVGSTGLYNARSFRNTAGGYLTIDRASTIGLSNEGGSFVNQARVSLGTSVGSQAVNNRAPFDNQGCGALLESLGNGVIGNVDSFTNTGTIIENSNGTSNISSNGGLVQNLNGGTFTITTNTGVLTTSPGNLWTGCVSRNWNTAGNWASGTVPTVTDDVVIPSTPVNQPIISTTATAKSVHVQQAASLSISSAGSLTINNFATLGGFTNAFYNQGTVTNDGTLMLGNTAPVGLIGLHNTGTFTNTGRFQIDRATNQGINNRVTATFTNTGIITIGAAVSMGTQGIWNQASFTNTGGTITIDRITGDGLLNSGNFVNSATITIGASATVTGSGLTNAASFTNATGGQIQIDQTGGQGIVNTAAFINAATINVGSLTTVTGNGILVSSSGSFSNIIGGNIIINRSGSGLNNQGTFVNSASVTIGNVAFTGHDNILNTGPFINNATGEIRLDRAIFNGINHVASSIQNAGKIIVGSIAGFGSGILAYAPFTNTGEIRVDRCNSGVVSTSTFTNTGQITIGASASLSAQGVVSTGATATFVNSGVGTINIDRTGGNGLSNANGSTFTNSATITIGVSAMVGSAGLNNEGTFASLSQGACALLTVYGTISNSGNFVNDGFFTANTTTPHSNTGTLTNNGIINYPQGNPIPNVVNNDLIVAPVSSCSAVYANALQIGGSNSFSVGTTWYADPNLTPGQEAGTYNPGTNIFTATNLPPATNRLYFPVIDNVNTCSRTVAIAVNQLQPGSASIQSLVVNTSACPYRLQGVATGSSFVFTGPNPGGYVFSNVYRNPGTYPVEALNIKQPGTYTLTVTSATSCGVGTVSQNVTISASQCP